MLKAKIEWMTHGIQRKCQYWHFR